MHVSSDHILLDRTLPVADGIFHQLNVAETTRITRPKGVPMDLNVYY
jgi:hypothetical protein